MKLHKIKVVKETFLKCYLHPSSILMIFYVKYLSVLRQLIIIRFLFIPQCFLKAILALQRIFYRKIINFFIDKMWTSTLLYFNLKFKLFSLMLAFFNIFLDWQHWKLCVSYIQCLPSQFYFQHYFLYFFLVFFWQSHCQGLTKCQGDQSTNKSLLHFL